MRTKMGLVLFVVTAILLVVGRIPAAVADIEPFPMSISPAVVTVDSASVFTVQLSADSGASQFNAYEVTIAFAPSVLEFEAVTEGALMLSGCGNTFRFLVTTDSTVTYSHSLLCGGVSLDGPGVLSSYRFRAVGNGISELKISSSPDSSVFDAGIFVSPAHPSRPRQVTFTGATAVVGPNPTGGPLRPTPGLGGIRVQPNPMRGPGVVHFDLPRAGWVRMDILDVRGRRVFTRPWSALRRGPQRTEWAGRDGAGRPLPGGVYFVRVSDGRGSQAGKVTLVR